jgi:hypothetical protein
LGAAAGAAALLLAISAPGSRPAHAQSATQHRAAIVIDTGAGIRHVCIRFTADYISGKDALDLANQVDPSIQPTYVNYGGMGAFVCSLCGVGNPQGDCTGKQSGKYWAYDRAPSGTNKFSTSSMGVSSTEVRDGDVEGWYWGAGGAPPYASVDQVCGTVSTDGTFTPTSVSTNGGPPQPARSPAVASANPRRATPPAGAAGTAPASVTSPSMPTADSSSTSTPESTAPGPSGTALAQLPQHKGDSGAGGSWAGLAGFAAIGTGLGAWFWWLRHARRAGP